MSTWSWSGGGEGAQNHCSAGTPTRWFVASFSAGSAGSRVFVDLQNIRNMRNNSSNPSFLGEEVPKRNLTALGNQSINRKNMSQTSDLFRKYLLVKAQNTMFNLNEQESADANIFKRPLPSDFKPPQFGRAPSNLETRMFPQIRMKHTATETADISSKSNYSEGQLTILYAGAVNVYDNVPVEKAEAIMLLASPSSSSNSLATRSQQEPIHSSNIPSIAVPTRPLPCLNLPSDTMPAQPLPTTNSPSGLHIARKQSLQRFLEKRRDRIANKSPYASPMIKQGNDKPALDGCSTADETILQPFFPSHLRCRFPVASLHTV